MVQPATSGRRIVSLIWWHEAPGHGTADWSRSGLTIARACRQRRSLIISACAEHRIAPARRPRPLLERDNSVRWPTILAPILHQPFAQLEVSDPVRDRPRAGPACAMKLPRIVGQGMELQAKRRLFVDLPGHDNRVQQCVLASLMCCSAVSPLGCRRRPRAWRDGSGFRDDEADAPLPSPGCHSTLATTRRPPCPKTRGMGAKGPPLWVPAA